MTLLFNSCPKCKGTLQQHSDGYGNYLQCISCSLIVDVPERKGRITAKVLHMQKVA